MKGCVAQKSIIGKNNNVGMYDNFCSNCYYKKQRNSELIHTGILKIIPRPYSGIAEGSVFVAVAVVKQAGFYFFGEEITA